MEKWCLRIAKGLPALCLGALMFAAQTAPDNAVSNISHWVTWLHIHLPDAIKDKSADVWIFWVSLILLVIYCLVLFILYKQHKKVKIKIVNRNLTRTPYTLTFEAVNLGDSINSLEENITLSCLFPSGKSFCHGQKYKCDFTIAPNDRSLEPHKPKTIIATSSSTEFLVYSWFQKYTFKPSKGCYSFVYMRNAMDGEMFVWRYRIEKFLFRIAVDLYFKFFKQQNYVLTEKE
jgi:hypothetical protein